MTHLALWWLEALVVCAFFAAGVGCLLWAVVETWRRHRARLISAAWWRELDERGE